MSIFKTTIGALLALVLSACGGGGGDAKTPDTTPAPTSAAVASLLLFTPSPLTLSADGISSKLLTVRALDANGGLVKGAVVALSTGSAGAAILSQSSVTTDATTGLASVTLTANSAVQSNRTATVTASCSGCTASPVSVDIAVNGATLALSSSGGTTLTADGTNPLTLSAALKDVSGVAMPAGTTVNFSLSSGAGIVGLSAATATTNSAGIAPITVSGLAVGSATILATVPSLNVQSTIAFSVQAASGTLAITSPANNAPMLTNLPQTISVSAPGASSFSFFTTLGTFSASTVNGSTGSSDLTATQAGSATVTVVDNLNRAASIVLKVSPSAANLLVLNASQTTLGLATATAAPSVNLTATALFASGNSQQPVANVPILFTMSGGPGAGERLSTAYQLTDSSGNATAVFYSGTRVSIQNGIVVSAMVQGTSIQTGTGSNGPDAKLTIGGTALSVAIGQSSVIRESIDKTTYILDHSVQVTDASNHPVAGQVVSLSVRPVAFSLGSGCAIDKVQNTATDATYCAEDGILAGSTPNGNLDAGEDGVRKLTTVATAGQCASLPGARFDGAQDAHLTPQNSAGGSVPATVTTTETGIASFSLTYLKASAIWLVDQLSASVSVSGTESGSSTIFQLPATIADKSPCAIPNSPFAY